MLSRRDCRSRPERAGAGQNLQIDDSRIINSAQPAAIAIEHPLFEVIVNLKSAERRHIVVPKQALDQAVRIALTAGAAACRGGRALFALAAAETRGGYQEPRLEQGAMSASTPLTF